MNPFLFAICMFIVAITLNALVSFFINLSFSRKNKRDVDVITVIHEIKDLKE